MDLFIPDIYAQSIYTIDYKKLKKNGIKCLLFDLDNTIVPYKIDEPTQKVKELFAILSNDFKLIIISNSTKNRLRPFKEKLNIDVAYSSRKPFKTKYQKIMELYHYKQDEIACIGDQLLTDILGSNRMGFTSVLVNSLTPYEPIWTKVNRFFERPILKRLARQKLLVKGQYFN